VPPSSADGPLHPSCMDHVVPTDAVVVGSLVCCHVREEWGAPFCPLNSSESVLFCIRFLSVSD